MEELRTGKGSTCDGMIKGFGLRLGRGRSSEGSLGFSGTSSVREESNFL